MIDLSYLDPVKAFHMIVPHTWRSSMPAWMGPLQPDAVGGSSAHGRGLELDVL